MPHYHYNLEEWCEQCLPAPVDSPAVDFNECSQDYPANCAACGALLDCSLTPEGVDYVCEYLDEAIHRGQATDTEREWANMIRHYGMKPAQRRVVDRFLELFPC